MGHRANCFLYPKEEFTEIRGLFVCVLIMQKAIKILRMDHEIRG